MSNVERIYIFSVPYEDGEDQEEILEHFCRFCAKDEGLKFKDCADWADDLGWDECSVCCGARCPSCGSHDYRADNNYPIEYAVCEDCGRKDRIR